MAYEAGMLIMFDVVTKGVFVEFRNRFENLPGPYANRAVGIAAGEAYCHNLGWDGTETRPSSKDNEWALGDVQLMDDKRI
ncbi:hypothetical protein [Rhizobium sp. Root483D2]|uniref:hypothetical protein n=1 Tax=Rhizobium sp. Root483D2 TaxID=1736545 RepID=UPI000713D1CD|nr:hypothetical protein [Rhizobium sp. Root483D2]KQY31843.1 hypothetical protein ASD32_04445 [Rhizobium sp. Root483D2]